MKYPNLFSPYRIKNTVFRNRIFAAPNGTKYKTPEGYPTELEASYFETRAKGGAAVVTTGNSAVDSRYLDQTPSRSITGFDNMDILPYLTELALGINRHGAMASIELNHAGPMANPKFSGGRDPIGPSAMQRNSVQGHGREAVETKESAFKGNGIKVREMTEEDMEEAIEAFANAALTAKTCGFNMCMVHGGHGWLIGSFLSNRTNHRTDRWGGSIENRARLAVEICKRIRKKCGEDFLIEFRLSATQFVKGGITLEEAIETAKILDPYIDILHVSAAGLSTAHHNPEEENDPEFYKAIWSNCPTPHLIQEQGCYIKYAEAIKKSGIKTPVVAVGAITDVQMAEDAIASGKCDFVAMARALIADPELPNKAKAGLDDEIRPCIRCEKCNDRQATRRCTVNPALGPQQRLLYARREPKKRNVVVVGGGPGGMQAAITAFEQGHDVTLIEKSDALGGLMKSISKEYLKREMKPFLDYLIRKTNSSAKVLLNTEATPELLRQLAPDYIIAAVGADPVIPPIPGVDMPHVITAAHLHDEGFAPGRNVAVIGGGVAGCEIAYELGREGHKVSIIEVLPNLAPERDKVSRNYTMPIMSAINEDENVTVYASARCLEIRDKTVVVEKSGEQIGLPADTVIISAGLKPRSALVDSLWNCAPNFRPIGDCVSPRFITDATNEGFFAAMDIQ
ncbi:MAG: FAD-dependent oxidoreductase [Firmicutes bacterium]|nr:FAD-dependent oxidoreductase [Bacillota bacterium]